MFTDHYIYNEHIYNEHIYEEFISFNTKFINKSKSVSSNKTMISHISKLFILFIIFTTFLCLSSSHDTPTKNVMTIKIVVSLFCLHDLCHHTHTHTHFCVIYKWFCLMCTSEISIHAQVYF
jgi:hypothetical protein